MNKLAILLVRYGLPELENNCLFSLISGTTVSYSLQVVDNFKSDRNLTDVWNDFWKATKSKWLCFLNGDTILSKMAIQRLILTAETDEQIGVIGPRTNHSPTPQKIETFKVDPTQENINKFSEGLWAPNKLKFTEAEVTGFCYLIKKEALDAVGGFDPKYPLFGQESKVNMLVREKKFKIGFADGVFVYHVGGAYYKIAKAKGKDVPREQNRIAELYKSEFGPHLRPKP